MTIAPKLRYRTQANIDRLNAMRAKGLNWDEIAEVIGIGTGTLDGWRRYGLKPHDEWQLDEALCEQLAPIWRKYGMRDNATRFDERAAKMTGRSADDCRKHRLHVGLTRADCGGGDACEIQWARAASMADKQMRRAMERFYANRVNRMAAE